MDGLMYLTQNPAEYSNNIVLDATWALTIYCLVRAIRTERLRWWIWLGIVVD